MSPTPEFILQPLQQSTTSASTSSDSSFILQTKNVEIVSRPRLEHLKFYVLAKLRPFQLPIIILLIAVSLAIILRKIKRKK